jgi:hypothetical protein
VSQKRVQSKQGKTKSNANTGKQQGISEKTEN